MSNKVIWKYPISATDEQTVEMPEGAEILDVQLQRGSPAIWALVTVGQPKRARRFVMFGTGHEVKDPSHGMVRVYIGTFQLLNGDMVLHVFEEVEAPAPSLADWRRSAER